MPELPEAETIAADLRQRVIGRTVKRVRVTHADILAPTLDPPALERALRGREITAVGRRGKNVMLTFSGDVVLLVNLGMTGRLVVSSAARAAELRHVAVRFDLDRDALLYDDMRRFGRMDVYDRETWPVRNVSLGLEPLSDAFTAEALHTMTRRSITPIRNWLLDQRFVAGVGNIYANEALFHAGVRPTRRARTLTRKETARLRDALRDVLAHAIRVRGTTISDYRDGNGEVGGFDALLQVYGRSGDDCVTCGSEIRRIVLTNRSAFYCRRCQR
jgi:formamidopyrimidine-DNA glycosylase